MLFFWTFYSSFSTLIIIKKILEQQISIIMISEDHVTLKSNDAENTEIN